MLYSPKIGTYSVWDFTGKGSRYVEFRRAQH